MRGPIALLFLGGPPVVFLAFFWGAINYLALGGSPYRPEMPYIIIGLTATLLCMIPLVIFFRKVSISSRAIIGHRFLGPSTRIPWDDVIKVEMNTLNSSQGSMQSLRIISKRGPRIVFQSIFSNFGSLVVAVEASSPVTVLQNPPAQI